MNITVLCLNHLFKKVTNRFKNSKIVSILSSDYTLVTATKKTEIKTSHYIFSTDKKSAVLVSSKCRNPHETSSTIWNQKKLCYKHFVFTCFSNV